MKKILLFLVMSVLMVASVQAAAYIKFDGIDGEAKDDKHRDWIELLSFSQTFERQEGKGKAARRRGGAVLGDVVIVKELDKSSPKLAESVSSPDSFFDVFVEFTAPMSGDDGTTHEITYLKYTLQNVQVTSYAIDADSDGDTLPVEEFSLNFEEIEWTYTAFDKSGDYRGHVTVLK